MDALTPITPLSSVPTGPPVPLPQPAAKAPAPAPLAVPAQTLAASVPLPALPAAVQRHQLDPPTAKMMTREEMLSLLSLVV